MPIGGNLNNTAQPRRVRNGEPGRAIFGEMTAVGLPTRSGIGLERPAQAESLLASLASIVASGKGSPEPQFQPFQSPPAIKLPDCPQATGRLLAAPGTDRSNLLGLEAQCQPELELPLVIAGTLHAAEV